VLHALRHYADIVMDAHLRRREGSPEVVLGRRDIGMALGAAETSLERLLAEPLRSAPEAEDAMLLVTYARRLAGAFTTLDAQHDLTIDERTAMAVLAYVRNVLDSALSAQRDRLPNPPVLGASTPGYHALARIVRHAELVGARPLVPRSPSVDVAAQR
jgi:hypothetical protein